MTRKGLVGSNPTLSAEELFMACPAQRDPVCGRKPCPERGSWVRVPPPPPSGIRPVLVIGLVEISSF